MMKSAKATLTFFLLSVGGTMTNLGTEKDRTLLLSFVPQEITGASAPDLAADIFGRPVQVVFEDGRPLQDGTLVGEGTGDDDELFSWRATNDVKEFAHQVLLQVVAGWGVRVQESSDLVLRVRFARFNVSERDQAVGSMYAAEARVTARLEDAAGHVLGEGLGSGDARRYGRKRSGQNCIEVLSDALKEAYSNLLDDSVLRTAWAGGSLNTAARLPQAPPTIEASPAELLAELIKLRNQGFTSDLMVEFVRQKTLSAALSAQDVIAWKEAGIPEPLIRAALERAAERKVP